MTSADLSVHTRNLLASTEPENEPREECGVFGVWAPGEDVSKLTYYGLYALQHRGQEAAGIAVADGSQVLGLTWGDDPQNIDPDLDEDDPESNWAQGYNCYTYADLYDVDKGFDLSRLPAEPWELDSLEGNGLSLVDNMEQHMYKKSELPSEEDALGEYANPAEGWKAVAK